jgi:serine phosphatase RsbU (regulator of sigma subunit)
LEAPVAFVALAAAARPRSPSRTSACPPSLLADAFCRNILRGGVPLAPTVDDAHTDPRTRDNPLIATTGVTAWACRPVEGPTGDTLGLFCVLDTAVRAWTARDAEIVTGLAHAAAGELELRNDAAKAARDTQRTKLLAAQTAAQAQALQDSLSPPPLPGVPGIQVAARHLPAADGHGVLGDFYDVFPGPRKTRSPRPLVHRRLVGRGRPGRRGRPGERWDTVIGDVSGHGVDAAALTALARYTIRAVAMREKSPAHVLGGLNAALLAQRPDSERFLTAAYVMLFPARGRVEALLASAGHTPALLRDPGGAVRAVGRHGLPLGLFDRPELVDTRLSLRQGDTLLLYTDGVTEARRGREQYGEERLRDLFADEAWLDVHDLALAVEKDVLAFTGGPHTDDIAVLALRVADDRPRPPASDGLRIPTPAANWDDLYGPRQSSPGGRPHSAA